MNTTSNVSVKVNPSEVFPVANKIRAEKKISMKEAYAIAKEQIINARTIAMNVVETPANVVANTALHTQLSKKMKHANVKFTFTNAKGKNITTTGTLDMSKVPTNRTVHGRKTAKTDNDQVFYDIRHGVYRSYQKDKVVEIF